MKSYRLLIIGLTCFLSLTLALGAFLPATAQASTTAPGKPALYDFGRGMCSACIEMEKVLTAVKQEYGNQVEIRLVMAEKDPSLFKQYKIMLIPTQVFLDAKGHEVERHVGGLSKDQVINKLKKLKFIH